MQLVPVTLNELRVLGEGEFYAYSEQYDVLVKIRIQGSDIEFFCTTDQLWEPLERYWAYHTSLKSYDLLEKRFSKFFII